VNWQNRAHFLEMSARLMRRSDTGDTQCRHRHE